jgi:hypothetical protein
MIKQRKNIHYFNYHDNLVGSNFSYSALVSNNHWWIFGGFRIRGSENSSFLSIFHLLENVSHFFYRQSKRNQFEVKILFSNEIVWARTVGRNYSLITFSAKIISQSKSAIIGTESQTEKIESFHSWLVRLTRVIQKSIKYCNRNILEN